MNCCCTPFILTSPLVWDIENFGLLDNDIYVDVLLRFPAKYLLGLKSVCKGWHLLIPDHTFSRFQSQRRETVSGFLFQERFQWCPVDIQTITHIPVELGSAGLRQLLFNFLPEDVVVMSSCNGLVCCCIVYNCLPCENPDIHVCNPVNKDWIKLKWTKPCKEDSIAVVFDPCQDMVDSTFHFKVVRVQQFESEPKDLYFSFDIYSSKTGTWRVSKKTCHCNGNLYKNKGIYIQGILHWLTGGDDILTFDIENELSCLISAPVSSKHLEFDSQSCIGESDGQLYYIMICKNGLHIWFLEDYFECQWNLKYSKTLEAMEEEHPTFFSNLPKRMRQPHTADSGPWMDPLAFKDGYLLLRVWTKIYLYHVETNKINEVVSDLGMYSYRPTVVPYSLSLVPLN